MTNRTAALHIAALVTRVSDDRRKVSFRVDNGTTTTLTSEDPTDWEVGGWALWSVEDQAIYPSSIDLQFDAIPLRVGVVKKIEGGRAVIAVGDHNYTTPAQSKVKFKVGALVEFRADVAVTRRLAKKGGLPGQLDEILNASGLGVNDVAASNGSGETFDDFLGYESVKRQVMEVVQSDAAFRGRLSTLKERPLNGILFTGPPGTGKTFMARIVAHESGAAFYPLAAAEITSQWVNRSEANLRELFAKARSQDRAIIYFDEIDSIASKRGRDSANDSQKLVGQLLAEMDGFDQRGNVTVIAATNNPDVLDPALRRAGRFDWEIEFPLPDHADRSAILNGLAAVRPLAEPIDFESIVDATEGWTPARLRAIWTNAAMVVAAEERDAYTREDIMEGFERATTMTWNESAQ
ncbi:ATP-binding protein [Rathayibacter sp. KR2-224]|uniref:ATP-binding protein n=1 Tax=Rathayibacter sp. KR2-224 TaxID=3400913 RepID=UPI003C0BD8BC